MSLRPSAQPPVRAARLPRNATLAQLGRVYHSFELASGMSKWPSCGDPPAASTSPAPSLSPDSGTNGALIWL